MIHTATVNAGLDRELAVPQFTSDEVLRASEVRVDWDRNGFNVSWALFALGIRTDLVQTAGQIRINVSIVTEDHAHYVQVNDPGPTITSAEQSTLLDKVRALAQPGDWWVLAGSLPPGVPVTFYGQVIRLVQSAGAHAVLDTSGDPLRLGCAARLFLVKPNAIGDGLPSLTES